MYTILSEPRYKDKFIVIVDGENSDGEYCSHEEIFDYDKFHTQVAEDLIDLIRHGLNEESYFCDFENKTFDLNCSNLCNSTKFAGYEVLYYDENGICYAVSMSL